MSVRALHHYTLRCSPDELPELLDFYTTVIGLTVGARPDIPAPGYWLYAGHEPIVHLFAHLSRSEAVLGWPTGPVDHISFRTVGLTRTRARLAATAVPFEEAPIPDWPLHQIFLRDPRGVKIELTFFLDREEEREDVADA